MRAIVLTVLAVTGVVLGLPATTAAKHVDVTLSSPPARLSAGTSWTARLTTWVSGRPRTRAGAHPLVTIKRGSASSMPVATFRARRLGRPGRYVVAIVFPRAGSWRYVVTGAGPGEWVFGPVRVTAQR
jgi:hypothetical protein